MKAIEADDIVVCRSIATDSPLNLGREYVVRAVGDVKGHPIVRLCGAHGRDNFGRPIWYSAKRFVRAN